MANQATQARALLTAGKQATRPTAADRLSVTEALQARLHLALPLPIERVAPAVIATKGTGLTAALGIMAGMVLAGGAFWLWPREAAVPAAPAPAPQVVLAVLPQVSEVTPPQEAVAPVAVQAPPAAEKRTTTASEERRSNDRLSEEVAILSRAEKEFHAGRLKSALTVLEEHRRTFPRGALFQERVALRVHVLCGLGRKTDAEAELRVLKRNSPDSLHEGRAREACASN
jgi:hypothetical protein